MTKRSDAFASRRRQSRVAFVLGVCSLFLYFTLIVPLAAFILGRRAANAQDRAGELPSWMARVGMVLGAFGLVMFPLFWIYVLSGDEI